MTVDSILFEISKMEFSKKGLYMTVNSRHPEAPRGCWEDQPTIDRGGRFLFLRMKKYFTEKR